jgi:predicted transcriptional regulator
MLRRKILRTEAEEKLNKLRAEYEVKKNDKELDNYKEGAKKEYLINLSQEYYNQSEQLKREYSDKIYQAGLEEVETLKTQLKEQDLINKNKKSSMEDLLVENNNLIYSTYILNNGSVEQINNLLINNPDNKPILELVKAKLNTVEKDDQSKYSDVKQIIANIEVDKVQQLQSEIQSEYYNNQSNYPTNRSASPDLRRMFNLNESLSAKFFN